MELLEPQEALEVQEARTRGSLTEAAISDDGDRHEPQEALVDHQEALADHQEALADHQAALADPQASPVDFQEAMRRKSTTTSSWTTKLHYPQSTNLVEAMEERSGD